MPQLDLSLETYVSKDAGTVVPHIADLRFAETLWRKWTVRVSEDRGAEGIRWIFDNPQVTGSCEVWVESASAGCVLHTFLRADRFSGTWPKWRLALLRRQWRAHLSEALWELKDRLEG